MQDGAGKPYTTIPLPCASAGDSAEALAGPGACTLDAFRALAQPLAFNSTADWCAGCVVCCLFVNACFVVGIE